MDIEKNIEIKWLDKIRNEKVLSRIGEDSELLRRIKELGWPEKNKTQYKICIMILSKKVMSKKRAW